MRFQILCVVPFALLSAAQSSELKLDPAVFSDMLKAEELWAKAACGTAGIAPYVADDFRGTSTRGNRTVRADVIEPANPPVSRDCKLGKVTGHAITADVAILLGEESRIQKLADGTETKRCQVWTDTWLKRNGKWQIVAAQDTIIPCPAE